MRVPDLSGKSISPPGLPVAVAILLPATPIGEKFVLDAVSVEKCEATLRAGGLVVHPTDTVYGLAADPFQEVALVRLYAVKERPRDLAVSICVGEAPDLFRFGERTALAEAFCAKNLPGPYTVVLRATPEAPKGVIAKDGRIGLRLPAHPIPRLLAKRFGPITSTSANRHGQPAPVTCEEAWLQLGDRVDVYVDGGPTPYGQESSVVDLTGPRAKVLRQGAVPMAGEA